MVESSILSSLTLQSVCFHQMFSPSRNPFFLGPTLTPCVWQYVAIYICDLCGIGISYSCPVIDVIINIQGIIITTDLYYATLFPSPQTLTLKCSNVPHYYSVSPFFTSAF